MALQLVRTGAALLDDYVTALDWSAAEGGRLATASAAGTVAVFAVNRGMERREACAHANGADALAWHPTLPLLASGGGDGCVHLWDAATGRVVAEIPLGREPAALLAWRPGDGESRLAAACGRRLVLLDPAGAVRHEFPEASKHISAFAWAPDGATLAASHFGGVRLFDQTGDLREELGYDVAVRALTWSPDGRWLVVANQDASVHIWDRARADELHMRGYEEPVRALAFDRASRWLATNGGPAAFVWDCGGPGPRDRTPVMLEHEASVGAVAFQRRSGLLATASEDGEVVLWSPERMLPRRARVRLEAGAPTLLAWSPDDRLLAVGGAGGGVEVFAVR